MRAKGARALRTKLWGVYQTFLTNRAQGEGLKILSPEARLAGGATKKQGPHPFLSNARIVLK
jgi:hypothetical protein